MMKKFLFIFVFLLFIPLTTQAKVYEHPIYNFSFEYPNDWEDIKKSYPSIYSYLILKKIDTYKNKTTTSTIFFDITYDKNIPANYLSKLTIKEKKELLDDLENILITDGKNNKLLYSGIQEINGVYYVIIKYKEGNSEDWVVQIYKNNLIHSLLFSTNGSEKYFEPYWLQILDSYTKNL